MNNEKEIKNLKNVYSEIDNIRFEKVDNDIEIDKGLMFNGLDVEDLSKLESTDIHNDIMRVLVNIATSNMDSKILSEEEKMEEIEVESKNNVSTNFEEKLSTRYSRILQSDPTHVTHYNINNIV